MALRELMKLDTSPHYQTSLNAFSDEALVNADEEMEEKANDEGNYCDGVERGQFKNNEPTCATPSISQ